MVRFVVFEILWISYLGGILLISLHHLSVSVFGRAKSYDKQRNLLDSLWFALLWPLAFFSSEGRNELKHKLTKLV